MEQHHYNHQRQTHVHWHKKCLTLHSLIPIWIHVYTLVRVSRTYNTAIHLTTESKEWICVQWYQMIRIQTPTSTRTRKQRTKRKPRPTWIFWSHTHPRIMGTYHKPNLLSPCCRWFWHEIHRQSRRIPPYRRTGKHYEIYTYWTGGLKCGVILKCTYYRDIQKLYVDISMLSYITKQLKKYQHKISKRPQHSPYP